MYLFSLSQYPSAAPDGTDSRSQLLAADQQEDSMVRVEHHKTGAPTNPQPKRKILRNWALIVVFCLLNDGIKTVQATSNGKIRSASPYPDIPIASNRLKSE